MGAESIKGVTEMKIQDILNQSKPFWKYAAMNKSKNWVLFERKPNLIKRRCLWEKQKENHRCLNLSFVFDIEPFDGDWKDSLICREVENERHQGD